SSGQRSDIRFHMFCRPPQTISACQRFIMVSGYSPAISLNRFNVRVWRNPDLSSKANLHPERDTHHA
ncbi:MAG: hypothetical protein P4L57_08545, partial [Rhizomicrobium sp.]|nr:hypothetical protein [Rhizomicrobium sp.]